MNTVFILKRLLALLIISGLALAPLTAAPVRPSGRAAAVAFQQDDDTAEGVTFDTLLPASSYTVYIEARDIGTLLRSAEFRDTFEPIAPMLEMFVTGMSEFFLVRMVVDQADRLQHSRVMMAFNPVVSSLPEPLLAFELDSEGAAEEFETRLQETFGKLSAKSSGRVTDNAAAAGRANAASAIIRRAGRLVVLSTGSFSFKALRDASNERMGDDLNFRAARDHFYTEPLFIYYDMALAAHRKEGAANLRSEVDEAPPATVTQTTTSSLYVTAASETPSATAKPQPLITTPSRGPKSLRRAAPPPVADERRGKPAPPAPAIQKAAQPPTPTDQDLVGSALNLLLSGQGQAQTNDALAVALALENGALAVRALLISAPGAAVGPVPFLSLPVSGPGSPSGASNYMPADTDIFAAISIDWPRFYNLVAPQVQARRGVLSSRPSPAQAEMFDARRAAFEKANEVRIADLLAAALGNEVALSVPVAYLTGIAPGRLALKARVTPVAPLILISVRDREMLAPKLNALLEVIGLKPKAAKATTEKAGDIEITSFGNLAYAFIDDYLIIASRPADIRRAVEARANHTTLGAVRSDFQSYSQWQPRAPIAQVYISAAVLKSLFRDLTRTNEVKDEAAQEFLARYRFDPEPITYAASAEGIGARYELRIPRRVLMRFFSEIAASEIASRIPRNESFARNFLLSIQQQEKAYKAQHGRYAGLDEMEEVQLFKEMSERFGYKLEVTVSDNGYEVTATPVEYGKTARLSFYTDQSGVIREGDHAGRPASSSDKPADKKQEY